MGERCHLGPDSLVRESENDGETIEENLHEMPADFDKNFSIWLDQQTANTARNFDEMEAGVTSGPCRFAERQRDEALREGLRIRDFYPDYVGSESAYELIAEAYLGKGDKAAAIRTLEQYRDLGGRNISTLKKLAALEQESGQPARAEDTLRKLNYIYPEDEEIHYRLGSLLLNRGEASGAIREYQAVLQLQPGDPAESHYDLAKALRADHRMQEAKDQVLLALEAAPDFKPAQQLLLQLSQ